jgi:hypothetical protein
VERGAKVMLHTDPHSGVATLISDADFRGLAVIQWPSGVRERVHIAELKEVKE